MSQKAFFSHFATWTSRKLGHPLAFGFAVVIVVVWILSGPIFRFSDTWQLVINTGTTIITFLMVFLIQNSQNRDSEAMQVKLDEVIRALRGADNALLNTENLTEQELQHLQEHYSLLAQKAQHQLQHSNGRQKESKATGK
ncbi:MAG TPA: low affinity iron permease family protein [Ktedonobacteraceae bacterium]|jgi:low affinity Fe/Cu permease|nr:low affinity iron permease family protein [Ktedonobacteraceae bacterium]